MADQDLVQKIFEAGVVGAGGAGFPTHVKIKAQAEIVIVNAAECEPLLRVDQQLLEVRSDDILKALKAVMNVVGARVGYIGIKAKHREVIDILEEKISAFGNVKISQLSDVYPAGDEQILVYEVTGRIVPEGGIPLMVGVVVINVETLLNVFNAMNGRPVIEKYVTITGAVAKPVTVRVPIGTPVKDVIGLAGGAVVDEFAVIDGGPMMGKLVPYATAVVTKTTKGIIVLPANHSLVIKKQQRPSLAVKRGMASCCQCQECTDLCPRHLLGHIIQPHRIMRTVSHNITTDSVGITAAMLCSECGVCDYFACPLDLSPRLINITIKQELAKHGFKNPHRRNDLTVNPNRKGRQVPVSRLIARLGLKGYDRPAPLMADDFNPHRVVLPLKQSSGAPVSPVVSVGDRVTKGQLIGAVPEGTLGANLHASIEGVIKEISSSIVIEAEVING